MCDIDVWYEMVSDSCSSRRIGGKQILAIVTSNVIKMLRDRGYDTPALDQESVVQSMLNRRVAMTCVRTSPTSNTLDSMSLFMDIEERTGIKTIRRLKDGLRTDHLLIVSLRGGTSFSTKEIQRSDVKITFFNFRELLHHIPSHKLVPSHCLMTDDDVKIIMARYLLTDDQWPLIPATDAVVRHYDFPLNGIIRIQRRGTTNEEGIFFRKVVGT
jgi:DNA-directed RNA polymerase subunit H (RpoH/RPB5)